MKPTALDLLRGGRISEALDLLEDLQRQNPKRPGEPMPKGLPIMAAGEHVGTFATLWMRLRKTTDTATRMRMQALHEWLAALQALPHSRPAQTPGAP